MAKKKVKRIKKKTPAQLAKIKEREKKARDKKKALLLKLYGLDEILEVMGYYEGVGQTGWDKKTQLKLKSLEEKDGFLPQEFIDLVLEKSVDNGNFEDALKHKMYLPV